MNIYRIILIVLFFASCQGKEETINVSPVDWESRKVDITDFGDMVHGKTYLPVYSHIYHMHEHRTFDLAITVSIRNISLVDTIYILKADYFNTAGNNIRQYVKTPVYLKPMETIEIVISEEDRGGGSGANFVFDWIVKNSKNPPLFEAVMISTYGQQGLSFSTRGVQMFD
jgi:hypothetical protein